MSTSDSISTSQQPEFGYVILQLAQAATFSSLGDYFSISYLPSSLSQKLDGLQICLWLGPGVLDNLEIVVLLIWPGRGFLSVGPALNSKHPSRLVTIGSDTGSFVNSDAPNEIARELLTLNTDPCLLFIRWTDPISLVEEEARELSFTTLTLKVVSSCMEYLQGRRLQGDVIQSSALADWFAIRLKEFDDTPRKKFLFDPSILAVSIVSHLGITLEEVNKFDINRERFLLIPFIFIRNWYQGLTARLTGPERDGMVKALLEYSK